MPDTVTESDVYDLPTDDEPTTTTEEPTVKTEPTTKLKKPTDPFPTVQLRAFKSLLALGADDEAGAVTLVKLAAHAKISTNVMRRGIGPTNRATIAAHEARYGYRCLISRGMVKFTYDEEAGHGYYLTPLGLKKAEAERDAGNLKLGKPHVG